MDSRAAVSDATGSNNSGSLFDTVPDSPARHLTMKDAMVHTEFSPSDPHQSPPVMESLGQSEVEKFCHEQVVQERHHQQNMKHREWERKREEDCEKKYSDSQEVHRKKTLQRLQNDDRTLREQERKSNANLQAKVAASEERSERHLTIAAEEREREQRRMQHLRGVREKIDQNEFQKCAANEQREIERMEAQRQRVDDHNRQMAEKVLQAERP